MGSAADRVQASPRLHAALLAFGPPRERNENFFIDAAIVSLYSVNCSSKIENALARAKAGAETLLELSTCRNRQLASHRGGIREEVP